MSFPRKILPPLAMIGALALVPVTASQMAVADTNYDELEKFMSIYERVKASYVEPVDDHTLIKGAIDGMLSALDPHSSYAENEEFDTLRTTSEGNYGGLGLTVTVEDGAVKVVTPTEDTPGWRAGIKAGDYITHINGELLYGYSLDEAVGKMRGDPGTTARVTIVRPGRDKPLELSLVRERINVRPVKWQVKDNVGIIKLIQFSGNSGDETKAALLAIDKATNGRPLGYILDLRSNPGGVLDDAVEISDAFLERGEIVSQRGRRKDDIERYYARPGDMAHGLPVIVLVDSGSASAAEIVAGALQDHRRAIVMGEKSFGKGSVQTVAQVGPRSMLRLTTARYYTPSGKSVQAGGIDPDIEVPQLSDEDYKNRPKVREADLRRHLIGEVKADNALLKTDTAADPRFTKTAAELKKEGIEDFQLDYALKTLKRLAGKPVQIAQASNTKKPR